MNSTKVNTKLWRLCASGALVAIRQLTQTCIGPGVWMIVCGYSLLLCWARQSNKGFFAERCSARGHRL